MKNKHYIQFFYNSCEFILDGIKHCSHLIEACGSDSIFFLDGRNSLKTMIKDAENRIETLKNVKTYKFYEIRYGDFYQYKTLYRNFDEALIKENLQKIS